MVVFLKSACFLPEIQRSVIRFNQSDFSIAQKVIQSRTSFLQFFLTIVLSQQKQDPRKFACVKWLSPYARHTLPIMIRRAAHLHGRQQQWNMAEEEFGGIWALILLPIWQDDANMDCILEVDKEGVIQVLNDDLTLGHHQSKQCNKTTTWFANVANYKSDKGLKYVNITYFNLCKHVAYSFIFSC